MRRDPLRVALWAALGVSLIATVVYCLALQNYFVMPDELGYVQQATFIGDHLRPLLPGDYAFGSWSQLEPLLLAIPYRLFATPTAFDVAHVLNAIALVSAAWPAYLLTRRVTEVRLAAVLVAALTVAVPWLTLAGAQLTENVAYPAFVWLLLAAHLAVTEPRLRNDVLLLVAGGVGYAARTQLSLVVLGAVVGVVLHEVGWAWRGERLGVGRGLVTGLRRSARGHPLLVVVAVAGVFAVANLSSGDVLGGYAAPAHGDLLPPGTWRAARELLAQVVLGIGAIPLALTLAWLPATLVAPENRRAHALACLALPILLVVTVGLGSFSARFTAGTNDRYLFFFAPLLFLCSALFVLDRRGLLGWLAAGTAGAALLIGTATLAQRGPSLVSPAAAFHDVLDDLAGVPTCGVVIVLASAAALAVARMRSADRTVLLGIYGGVLLAFCAVETGYTMVKIADTQHASAEFLSGRDWIDRAVPGHERAAALLAVFSEGPRDASVARWWDTTFWNADIRRVLRLADPDDLIQKVSTQLTVDPRTGMLEGLGGSRWLVADSADPRLAVQGGEVTARRYGLSLLRLPERPTAAWAWDGLGADARLALGGGAVLRVWRPGPSATIALDGRGAPRPVRVRVKAPGQPARVVAVSDHGVRRVRVPLAGGQPRSVVLKVLGPPAEDPTVQRGPRVAATDIG